RRLDDTMDFVRLETASALKRDIPVIPVLVRGAMMPRADQLPPDLGELAYRNAVELTHARWDSDIEVLVKALRPYVATQRKDVGGAKTRPAAAGWAAGTVDASGEPGAADTESAAAGQSSKKSWRIVAIVVALIAIAVAGYVVYDKAVERDTLRRATLVTEAEKPSADPSGKAEPEKAPADSPKKIEPEKGTAEGARRAGGNANETGSGVKSTTEPGAPPALPKSYTLVGTWEDEDGRVFATVADPKQTGVFEMEQIKPRKEQHTLWRATLKGREVEIDVFRMPSGSHAEHMTLRLSLDGNRMDGLAGPGGASPDDTPPVPIRFRRVN
ncbi:MAG TPA: hypothetical protein VNS63_23470, partial [Blastocatellia bacterium]|nr:hypothetical protein [Blastocatellia bacterium]